MTDVKTVLSDDAALIEKSLDKYLSKESLGDGKLRDAMRYSTLGGGKRIRAALSLEFCGLFCGE